MINTHCCKQLPMNFITASLKWFFFFADLSIIKQLPIKYNIFSTLLQNPYLMHSIEGTQFISTL